MNRLLLSSLLLASAALSLAADITFETRATTLDKALQALSEQNNIAIKAVGPVAKQIVVISVNKQPVDTFLKHLTKALSATAILNNGVYEVAESAVAVKAEEDQDRAKVAQSFAKSLAEQSKTLDSQPASEIEIHKRLTELKQVMDQLGQGAENANNETYEKAQRLQESIPTAQLVRRLLQTIPPADLAALPIDQRVVFASTPTRMQRPLNAAAQKILTQFAQDYARLSAAVARFPREQQDDFMGMLGTYMTRGVPAKVILGFTRYAGENLAVEAQILDAQGRVLATGSGGLTGQFQGDGTAAKEHPANKTEKPLKISDESRTYQALISRGPEGGKGGIDIAPEPLKSKVLNPEKHDPLSYGVTDLLLAAAADRQKPMIVVLPDTAQSFDLGSTPKASDLFTHLQTSDIVSIDESEDWLVGKPVRPAEARASRINREAYGNLVRRIAANGYVTLTDLSNFAIAQGRNPGYESFFMQNMYALFGTALAGYDLSNWEGIRFFGFLGESNRKNMDGKVVSFQSLPKEAQNEISKLIYKQPSLGMTDFATPINEPDNTAMPCMDPTERLPNGIPGETQVRLDSMGESVVIPQGNYAYPMGASELASQIAMEERPDLFPWAQDNRVGDRFRLASRQSYSFEFIFTPNMSQALQLWDYHGVGKELITRAQLPKEMKDQFDQLLKEMRESYKGMKNEDLRGRGGPPPPAR